MPMLLYGNGTISGATSFPTAASFGSNLSVTGYANVTQGLTTASRGIDKASVPSGGILQVVQTVKRDAFSTSGTAFVDITGFNATITPLYSTSKVLIEIVMSCGEGSDAFPAFYVNRNGSTIDLSDGISPGQRVTIGYTNTGADGRDQYLMTVVPFKYLDSPSSTSALTYQVQMSPMRTTGRTSYLNRMGTIGDANQMTGISTITLMEIAQ